MGHTYDGLLWTLRYADLIYITDTLLLKCLSLDEDCLHNFENSVFAISVMKLIYNFAIIFFFLSLYLCVLICLYICI